MAGNTFGKLLQITTFGESHGASIGGILDGVPSGLSIDIESIQSELDRRRPGTSQLTTARKEHDIVEIFSGVIKNEDESLITTGTPVGFGIQNNDAKSVK